MPSNRLSVLFDRTLRPSKSASNILQSTANQDGSSSISLRKSNSREHLSVLVEYNFDQTSPPQRNTSPPTPPSKHNTATTMSTAVPRPVSPHRANTTPMMHPPDELFLKVIRRRSANARLEEQQRPKQNRHIHRDDEVATSVAIAYALPPQYFDLPPEYESPQRTQQSQRLRTRSTIISLKQPELFLDDPLNMQIDQVIADFGGFRVTEATPVQSSAREYEEPLVSPINEIDDLYLERRRQMKRQQRQQEQFHRNTT